MAFKSLKQRIDQSAEVIRQSLGRKQLPETLIVLGSGFKGFEDTLTNSLSLDLRHVDGMAIPKVEGHGASLVVGRVEKPGSISQEVAVLTGRVHLYEGYDAAQVVFPLRVMASLGIKRVLLTNAAGSLDLAIKPGQVVVLSDHINFTGQNCLVGDARELGSTFLDMGGCYDAPWRQKLIGQTAMPVVSGVYVGVMGPTYETPAETRMFGLLGAQVVGMSTVQEAIAAHQLGLRVAALSFVTNMAGGLGVSLHHADVLKLVKDHRDALKSLLAAAVTC